MKVNAEKTLFGPWFGIRSRRSERLNSGWICEDLPAVVFEGPALPTLAVETPTLVPPHRQRVFYATFNLGRVVPLSAGVTHAGPPCMDTICHMRAITKRTSATHRQHRHSDDTPRTTSLSAFSKILARHTGNWNSTLDRR